MTNEQDIKTGEALLPEEIAKDAAAGTESTETPAFPEELERLTKEAVLDRMRAAVEKEVAEAKDEVDGLKQAYYKLRKSEAGAVSDAADEMSDGKESDPMDEELKALLSRFKEKRTRYLQELEARKEANLEKKRTLIRSIRDLSADSDNINKYYPAFQELQQQFKEVREVPAQYVNELWKEFQSAVEEFYDLLKINKELRDYDFKKNLELKTALCESAEKLAEESDVVVAFKSLQQLHEEWRATGPVAKELREDIWNRFKAASTVVNKRHQTHFEELKGNEQENETRKFALCEAVEAVAYDTLNGFAAWDEQTKRVIDLQTQWKAIGFASRKVNGPLYNRFRKACDEFFRRKADYFKEAKEEMARNLEMKRMLCEKAEALKESTDWKHTTDYFVALQKEWKTVGPVAKKYSDAIWKRFIAACDHFFERKGEENSSKREEETANLQKKEALIVRLEALDETVEADAARQEVRAVMAEWSATGHVPFKEKDALHKRYQEALDKQFGRLQMQENRRRVRNFSSSVRQMAGSDHPQSALLTERKRLLRQYEQAKSDLQTYRNNMGFLTLSSKSGNGLLKELERKMQKLESDMAVLLEKIEVIDRQIESGEKS